VQKGEGSVGVDFVTASTLSSALSRETDAARSCARIPRRQRVLGNILEGSIWARGQEETKERPKLRCREHRGSVRDDSIQPFTRAW
jgi:hypothetical protein